MSKKWLAAIALLLVFASFLVACADVTPTETAPETDPETEAPVESESETVIETEPETEPEDEPEEKELSKGYALLFSEGIQKEKFDVTATTAIGQRITVADGYYLESITADCITWGDRKGSIELCIYRWDTDYATTVAGEPTFTYTIQDFVAERWDTGLVNAYSNYFAAGTDTMHIWYTVDLSEDQKIGAGEWLYVYANGTGNAGVGRCKTDVTRNPIVGDAQDVLSIEATYANGEENKLNPVAHVIYAPVEQAEPVVDPDAYTKLTPGKAHVILLTGQSNAAGGSNYGSLSSFYSAEQVARYEQGYDNVLVYSDCYDVDYTKRHGSEGFVPCKLGLGSFDSTFGPEVGLADYLSRAYPDETFYIIKAGVSGSSVKDHWNTRGMAYKHFDNHVETALETLKEMGKDPEIFAFVWLQGESDSIIMSSYTKKYMDNFNNLVDRIEEKYAAYMAPGGMALVDGGICLQTTWSYATVINLQKELNAATSQNYYYVDTNAEKIDTFDEGSDPMHYDSKDLIRLGEMFGETIEQILINSGMQPVTGS